MLSRFSPNPSNATIPAQSLLGDENRHNVRGRYQHPTPPFFIRQVKPPLRLSGYHKHEKTTVLEDFFKTAIEGAHTPYYVYV